MTDNKTQKRLFEQSLEALRRGEGEVASRGFRLLLKEGSRDPRHASFCGLTIATIDGKLNDGRVLCEFAVREAFYDPEMHLNLARVYEHGGRRTQAIKSLLEGLKVDPKDDVLRQEYARLDRRARPIVHSLGRDHPVNRFLGSMRARFSSRKRQEAN